MVCKDRNLWAKGQEMGSTNYEVQSADVPYMVARFGVLLQLIFGYFMAIRQLSSGATLQIYQQRFAQNGKQNATSLALLMLNTGKSSSSRLLLEPPKGTTPQSGLFGTGPAL